jgi:transposase
MNHAEPEQINEIVHRWHHGQSLRGIARDLGISRKRVARVVAQHQKARTEATPHPELPRVPQRRGSQLDPFLTAIQELLVRYPNITATRVHEELRTLGYQGGYTILKSRVRQLRPPKTKQLVVRFETAPGAQAQMDWSVYELDFTAEGRRRVNLFSYLLGYSRRQYLCFTEQQDFDTTVRQHVCAFEYLDGVAATCLYDNMKVVVQRWEDDQPLYNTRFLAFATHYGYRPVACLPRRPQTKGKVERPFHYAETSLLNGRTFRSLEHLNEVTRWWLANVADVRIHRETKKRPVDAHAEEMPHLLPLPQHHYDTAQVLYRVVSLEGFIVYRQNKYSVPWRYLAKVLPVRVTEHEIVVYDEHVQELAQHALFPGGQSGGERLDPSHRPPRDQQVQLQWITEQFDQLGQHGKQFLQGLLSKQRYGKHQAQRVLFLLASYQRDDALAALERAVRYHAYSLASLERILAVQATPKPSWHNLSEDQQRLLRELSEQDPVPPRPTSDYLSLWNDHPEECHNHEQEPERKEDKPPGDHA